MSFSMPNFLIILPEIFLLSMTCFILIVDLILQSKSPKVIYYLSQLTLIGTAGLSLSLFHMPTTISFSSAFILDPLASVLKIMILLTSMLVFWFAHDYVKSRKIPFAEHYLLALFAILGMMILVSAHDFIAIYLGLELSTLPTYALVALWRDSPTGAEAAVKYFVMGAFASAMLLYGLSMLYGITGSLAIQSVAQSPNNLLLVFALVFIIAGIAFKFGAAPFHLWVPDIYTGAPSAVTLFIGAAPKIAALGMAFRLLVDGMPVLHPEWQQLLIVLAIASMALGNFAAIVQTNLKRMLAYSSISHIGYMVLGLLAGTNEGYGASLFYMLSYVIMAIGAFGLLTLLSRSGQEVELLSDLRGLNARNPWLAFMMLLIMFSMAGIPPTVGFFAKLGVLEALISVHLVWLAILALIFAIIGAYYYINVVKVMYFEEPLEQSAFECTLSLRTALTISGITVLWLGIMPSTIITLCHSVFQ